ncbi:MAG TPA: hypothetical protein VN176_06090 [Verrucomicrobiae bacterium]|jgi:hypothetical protein|nr:hypothetical protein [Verrucomicrobiae bacterium]
MKSALCSVVLLSVITVCAQVQQIRIAAGSPEDQASQAISNEKDAQKRAAMWQDFVQKFASNADAVAYGNSQLSQQFQDAGDIAKAMEYDEKALAAQPRNLELLVTLAGLAERVKANEKTADFAIRGGAAFTSIATQPKPEGATAEQFAANIKSAQDPLRSSYEYLEALGVNAVMAEQDNKLRMSELERFAAAFPNSRFQDQLLQVSVYTLGQLKDSARLASFAEKALAASPNSLSTLVVLAAAFADLPDAASTARAESYARKALELAKTQTGEDAGKLQFNSGLAHSTLAYALLKQDKAAAAIQEFKAALPELKGNPEAYQAALFRLGYAYGKTNRAAEAKAALSEAAGISGPYQQPARELLAKIEAVAPKSARKK